jgi:hypothetical protein
MRRSFHQLVDGVGVEMTPNEVFRFVCCDCGLVHDMVIATVSKKPFGLAVRRNKRATSARRRRMLVETP